MTTFTIWTDQIGDNNEDDFYPRFNFTANSQKQATSKAAAWAAYHSFNTNDVVALPAEGEQADWEPKAFMEIF